MAVDLVKRGGKVSLTKNNPSLNEIFVGLGWDTNKYDGGHAFDLDASLFLLGADNKCKTEKDFVYYGNLTAQGVVHTGDNLTGEGDGDDEVINITLNDIDQEVQRLTVAIAIYDADVRKQNFGQVSNAFIRVVDRATGAELVKYDLEEDFSTETAIVVGEIYRHNGEWKFNAVGSGFNGGFATLLTTYGLN